MTYRKQPRKSPVGLRKGDKYATPWGDIKILDKREKVGELPLTHRIEYKIKDPNTGEETWLDFDMMVRIMQSNIFK